jgi:MFS transporter, putative metabolite:H+ symporter
VIGAVRERASALLEPRHWKLLMLLGAANFFEGYDLNIVVVALPQLQATYHITQARASLWVAVIYAGAAPALFLTRLADRRGRRKLLLVSITGFTLATLATAAAPSILAFACCQLAARFFLCVESVLVWTVVAEELPAGARGFGFGWLAMLSAVGTGASAVLYGGILAPLGLSWRVLYLVAVPVLVVVALARRQLPESARFTAAAGQGALARRWTEILRPGLRRRLALVCVTAVLVNITAQATAFVIDFMENDRHLSATAANFILIGAGAVAVPILIVAGRISDRYGRKRICCAFLGLSVAGLLGFFVFARSPAELALALAVMYAGQFGAWPTGTAFGAELFPTALRALGASAAQLSSIGGQVSSFVIAGALIGTGAGLSRSAAILAIGPLLGAVLIATRFPETAGAELEAIPLPSGGPDGGPAPDPAGPAGPDGGNGGREGSDLRAGR